jgi:hypothetical protein
METRYRELRSHDAGAVRTLLMAELGSTPWQAAPLDALDEALRATGDAAPNEAHGIVAERGEGTAESIVGAILFGMYAGTQGSARIRALVVDRAVAREENTHCVEHQATVAGQLLEHAARALRAAGARLVIAELPGDATLAAMLDALSHGGFQREGEIPDFYREGVPMLILRKELDA